MISDLASIPVIGGAFEDLERARVAKWQAEARENLDHAVLDWDSFSAGKPAPKLDFAIDPETAKRQGLIASYLTIENAGKPLPDDVVLQGVMRDRVAQAKFEGRGMGDDAAFYGEIAKESQGRKDEKDLAQSLASTASTSELVRSADDAGLDSMSFALWREEAMKKPGYRKDRDADYLEAWTATRAAVKANIEGHIGPVKEAWKAMKDGELNLGRFYSQIPEGEREPFLASIALLAKTLPVEDQPTFWQNLTKSGGRSIARMGMDVLEGLGDHADRSGVSTETLIEDPSEGWMQEERLRTARDARNLEADIERIRDETYDPVKVLNPDNAFLRVGEKVAYAVPQVLASSGTAAMGLLGGTATFLQMEQAAYRDMRRTLIDQGMTDTAASDKAEQLAPIIAVPQAILEKVGAGALLGKLPGFERLMSATANKITNSAVRFSARTAAAGVYETAIENAQDFLPALAQETASALSKDVPGVVWKNGKDGFLDGYWENTAVTFGAILPLAAFAGAGGIGQDARAKAFADAPDLHLKALGYSSESVAAIREAQGKGLYSANAAIEAESAKRNPLSEESKAAVAQIEEEGKAAAAAAEEAQKSGAMPTFTRTADGWTVRDPETGQDIGTAATAGDALRLGMAHSSAIDEAKADQVAYLSTLLESADSRSAPGTTFDIRPGEKVTTAQQANESPADEARVLAQVQAREKLDGSGDFAGIVLGSSSTELKQNVRETVNRINAGGSVLTVFHEDTHGFFREAIATGRLTREETIAALRAFQTVGKTKAGEALQLLPDGEINDTQLDEAVSEFMEAEILRTRREGKHLPPGVISRNLTAAAKLAPGAAKKFARFAQTVREFFGLAFSRAVALKKGIREGKIKEADIEAFTAKLFGLDDQDAADRAGRDAEAEILNGAVTDAMIEGDPFSLGPARMADVLAGDATGKATNPKVKTGIFKRMAQNLGALRRDTDEIVVAFGKPATRKAIDDPREAASIRKEGAMREALRRAELEEAAMAKWGALLTDDDLTKLRSQPVHAALSERGTNLRGRLRSKAQFIKNQGDFFTSAAEYEGSETISRTLFGGSLSPDQAAQELFEAGLIKQPTPEAMWNALDRESQSVATMRKHRQDAEAEMKRARETARKEAKEWTADRLAQQAANYSPKARLLRSMAMLDGILAALPPDLRGRIGGYTQLAKLGTDEARLEYLQTRIAKAEKVVETFLVREYGKMLDQLFDRAKPAKDEAGKKKVGKAGADVHALFDVLRDARGWDAAKVDAHVTGLEASIQSGNLSPEEEAHATLEAGLVSLIGNWKEADAARRAAAIEEATRVFEKGYAEFKLAKLMEKEDRTIRRNNLRGDTGKAGTKAERDAKLTTDHGLSGKWKNSLLSLSSFEQVLHYVFGEKSSEANRLADMEREASNQKEDAVQSKMDALDALFVSITGSGLAAQQLRWDMAQKSMEVGGIELSQNEAVAVTLMWRQEDGRRHMLGKQDDNGQFVGPWHYDQAFVDEVESKLSPEALALRAHLTAEYAAEWAVLNPVYKALNGISLPQNANYSPISVAPQQAPAGQMASPITGQATGSSVTPGSLRTRGGGVAEPKFPDALQAYIAHTKEIQHFIAYAPFSMEAQAILGNRELGNSVQAKGGEQAVTVLRKWLDLFAQGGARDAASQLALNDFMGRMMNRASGMALVGRMGVLAIQSTQLGAALAEMPTAAFVKRLGQLLTGQLGWGAARKSEFVQRRISQMPPIVQQAMEGLMASEPNRVKLWVQKLGTWIAGADGLFTAGTFAMVYDYQLGQAKAMGMTGQEAEAAALSAAERVTERVAQPTRMATRSIYENNLTSPLARASWAFASEARQKLILSAWAIGTKPLGAKLRALAVTWIIGGMVSAAIRSTWRDLRDDDDDEVFDEKNWGAKRLALSASTGPFGGIPLLGDALEAGVYKASGEYLPEGNLISSLGASFKAATRVSDWGDSKPDEIMRDIENIISGFGLFNDTISATSSLSHLARDLFGVASNAID